MKSVIIVFPDEWLVYSPTLLNMISLLVKSSWKVTIIAVNNRRYPQLQMKDVEFIWVSMPKLYLIRLEKGFFYRVYKFLKLLCSLRKIRAKQFSLAIGVDSIGYCAIKSTFPNAVFLSLEVVRDIFWSLSQKIGIEKLIIQTEERRDYLLRDMPNVSTYYLQNSPIFDCNFNTPIRSGFRLIYFGNISDSHGVEYCADLLNHLDESYTLTLKGAIYDRYKAILVSKYSSLLNSHRLILDNEYVEQANVVRFLSDYDLGFCIYSESIIKSNDFNYISCPSGKLFNYYAAGIPVIGTHIIGLKSVSEFNTGILLDTNSPENIKAAVETIKRNYREYVKNCYRAAEVFDFRTNFDDVLMNVAPSFEM